MHTKEITPKIIFLAVVILISVSIWSVAFYTKEIKTYKNTVSVIGVATKEVTSDFAVWKITMVRRGLDRSQNLHAVTTDEKAIRSYLLNKGFPAEEISSSAVTVDPVYKTSPNGYGVTNEVSEYDTKSTLTVQTGNVLRVGSSAEELSRYTEENNIELLSNIPEYTYSKYETEKIPLLQKAIEDAQNRAQALVHATKGVSQTSIGKIVSAQQGVFQVNPSHDNSISDYGNYDTSSIDKTIRATVTVEFAAN